MLGGCSPVGFYSGRTAIGGAEEELEGPWTDGRERRDRGGGTNNNVNEWSTGSSKGSHLCIANQQKVACVLTHSFLLVD